jgi:circadian clock protein KaiC
VSTPCPRFSRQGRKSRSSKKDHQELGTAKGGFMTGMEKRKKTVSRQRASTGVPGLDDVLSGGLPAGHLYLIEGDPGAGKTTVGLQFLMHVAAQGELVLYVTLSESKAELEQGAESHGWSLDGVDIFEFAPTEQYLQPEDQYSHFHPSEVEFHDSRSLRCSRS